MRQQGRMDGRDLRVERFDATQKISLSLNDSENDGNGERLFTLTARFDIT